ncbi:MAG: 50S ribosome-binding GTPase [Planctomycetes bacterium]|nr:50S ribosome-binding GTPase [Planctomycetota bacterium]
MAARCLVSLVTPSGRGAVATIIVSGEDATERVAAHFHAAAGRPLAELPVQRICFGQWRSAEGPGEELVVCRRTAWVEIHCHGGRVASQAIIGTLVADGCCDIPWTEMARNLDGDDIAIEARIALAHARTERTAAILLDQLRGALQIEWGRITSLFSAGQSQEATSRLDVLEARSRLGLHLTEPFRVVVCGEPNVGKSSLINALLGYQRSIVLDQPGTTRDVITAHTAIDGWPIELSDTAGLRSPTDPIESAGIQFARRRLSDADLVVLVLDCSRPRHDAAERLQNELPLALVVHNKSDLASMADGEGDQLQTSAATGEGITELMHAISRRLVRDPPAAGEPIPFAERQVRLIHEAQMALRRGDTQAAMRSLTGDGSGQAATNSSEPAD